MQQCHKCSGLNPDTTIQCLHCDTKKQDSKGKSSFRSLTRLSALSLLSITLQACYGAARDFGKEVDPQKDLEGNVCTKAVDRDGDGYLSCESITWHHASKKPLYKNYYPAPGKDHLDYSENDCDDQDPGIHPGAFDPFGDAIDQNCDRFDGFVNGPKFEELDWTYDCKLSQDTDDDGIETCIDGVPSWAVDYVTVNGVAVDKSEQAASQKEQAGSSPEEDSD